MSAKAVLSHTLGIRAEAAGFNWAILSGDLQNPVLEASGTETPPTAYREAEALAWCRERAVYIIDKYRPAKVAVRYPERTAMGANKDSAKARCRVEGVALEAAGSKNLPVITGALNTFGKHLGSSSPKEDLAAEKLRGLDWMKYSNHVREAILVGVAVLPDEG